ncbi:MAG: DUF2933 domain-containing protein [Actinomycetota bacterium]
MKKELVIGIAIGAGIVALMSGASGSSLLFGLLVLACPLMMVFMMRGNSGHHTIAPPERELPIKKID